MPPDWRPRGFCIDADGVLHRGRQLLPGAVDLLNRLTIAGLPYRVVTNNSRERSAVSAAYYRGLGLPLLDGSVLTSAEAMATYVLEQTPKGRKPRVYVLGEPALTETLRSRGCQIVVSRPDFVCVGVDYRLSYSRLARASAAARECGRLVAANLDATIPRESGDIPGVGPIAAAVAMASGVEPVVAGKPAPTMFQLAVGEMRVSPTDALAIGDRLDSDVLGAERAGLRSALVLTGSHQLTDLPTFAVRPDFVFDDLDELQCWLFGC